MLNPKMYKNSRAYDFFMKSFGYDKSLNRFLDGLNLEYSGAIKILDAGCGTGILGLNLLKRFPQSTLVATDLEPNFLEATLENARRQEIATHRIRVGISDISHPDRLTGLDGQSIELTDGEFNIVCLGAVVGYSSDIAESLRSLVNLLTPGGTLINLEMNESPSGRYVSKKYHYRNLKIDQIQRVLGLAGCDVRVVKLGLKHLPAKFTRIGILATKKL